MKLLFVLVGVALAAHSSLPVSFKVTPNQEYEFRYEGAIASGLPMESDSALTRIQSTVLLQIVSDRQAILKLKDVQFAASHALVGEKMPAMETLEKREISSEQQKTLALPVTFRYQDGLVSELQFPEDEQPWSANIKRAVINMLQINLKRVGAKETEQTDLFYTLSEKTLEGECEVTYSVEQEPLTVTKTINFDKCSRQLDIGYGLRFTKDTQNIRTLVPQTVFTYTMAENFIKKVDVRSIYTIQLMDQSVLKTQVASTLTVVGVSKIRNQLETSSGKKEELMYSNEWEKMFEKFFKNGETEDNRPFHEYTSKVDRASFILKTITDLKENDSEMVHEMARLVRVFRMSTAEDLTQIHDQLYKDSDLHVKHIIEHSLAIAGTKNTIEHLIRHIEDKEITPIRAAQLLKSAQETAYHSEVIANLLLKLAKSEICREEPILRQAAWLAFGAVVRGVVAPSAEKYIIREDTKEVKQRFMKVLQEELRSAETMYDKVLVIKVIANSALDISVHELEKIIVDKKQPTIIRSEAISALRVISNQMPKKIQRLLLPIYNDRSEKTEIRTSAFVRIIYTIPSKSVIAQIVRLMETDPNQHVAMFTYTFLSTLADSNFASERQMIDEIKITLKQSSFQPNSRYNRNFLTHLPYYSEEWVSGAHLNIGSIFGKDSVLPANIMADFEFMVNGQWMQYFAQMGFSQQNVEHIIRKVYTKLEKEQSHTRGERNERIENGINLVKAIAQKLNIRVRERSTEQPFAMVYFRYKQMDYAVLPIDERMVDTLIEKYIKRGTVDRELLENILNSNMEFSGAHGAFVFERTRRLPTTFGIPLTFTAKMPTISSIKGKLSTEKISYGMRLRLQAVPTVATTQIFQLRLWTPLFENGVKLVRPIKVVLPIDAELSVQMKEKVEISLNVATPKSKQTIFSMTSQPIAFIRFPNPTDMNKYVDVEENTIIVPGWEKESRSVEQKYEIAGMIVKTAGHVHNQWSLESAVFGESDAAITVEPTRHTPKNIIYRAEIAIDKNARLQKPKSERLLKDALKLEEEQKEYYSQVAREVSNGVAISFVGSVETNEKSKVMINLHIDQSGKFVRMESDLVVPLKTGREWKWEQLFEVILPVEVTSMEMLNEQKIREILMISSSKWGSDKKNEIIARFTLEQTPEQKQFSRNSIDQLEGMQQYGILVMAGRLNKLRGVAKYDMDPHSEVAFHRILDIVRSYGYWSSSTEMRESRENHLFWELSVDPSARRSISISFQTPVLHLLETVELPFFVPLPTLAKLSKTDSSMGLKPTISKKSACKISRNVNTFDEVIFKAPLTTCYSVVAKDCSEDARYAVLVKKVSASSEKKIVKIVKESNEYELQLVNGKMQIRLNGEIKSHSQLKSNSIELVNSKFVVADLEEVIVHFDGQVVKIEMSNSEMNTQCGLCGHYDGDKSNIFRTADDSETEDLEEFHRSFLLKDEECSIEEEKVSEKRNYKIYKTEKLEESSEEYPREREMIRRNKKTEETTIEGKAAKKRNYQMYEESEEMIMRNKKTQKSFDEEESSIELIKANQIIEESHRVCISIEPVPTCPKKSTPAKEVSKKVKYACLPRHEPETRRLLKEVRAQPQRLEHSMSRVDKIMVPQACEVY